MQVRVWGWWVCGFPKVRDEREESGKMRREKRERKREKRERKVEKREERREKRGEWVLIVTWMSPFNIVCPF